MKINCWEFKKCGREPLGKKVNELGICPAATQIKVNGINSGKNGGRCCWTVNKTLCDSEVQGTFAEKMARCMDCEFYKIVINEEKATNTYANIKDILNILK
jgi:hypothetical protein